MADNNINKIINSVSQINNQKIKQNQNFGKINGKSFEDILKENKPVQNQNQTQNQTINEIKIRQYISKPASDELVFSKHAKQRLAQRNIDIDSELVDKIIGAVKKANEKSIKNALVLSEESAFIVSVDHNVVVTAMNNHEMRESVITNIDGTVIL